MRGKTLYVNGRIYSMEREGEIFGSMLTDGGRISALYEEPFPEQPRGRVRRVDLGGKTVLPGLTDCHSHFITTGALRKMSISISGISGGTIVPDSLEGVAAKIKEAGERTSKRKPLLCINYIIPSVAENRLPTSAELDAWLPGRSVIVLSMDGHSSSYSGRALKESGIGKDAPPEGILTGEAHEFNMGKVNSYMMKSISPALLLSGIAENVNDAAAHGLTGIHCLEGFEDDPSDPAPRLLAALAGGIPQKLRLYPQYMDLGRIGALEKKMLNLRVGGCGSWEMDGSVSSHSAAFFSDYADKPGCRGSIYYKADDLYRTVSAADARGYQVAAHAIGPGGIEIILGVFENLAREKGASGNERRHRIEHFEFPTADQVRRAAALGLIITVQPGFSWADEKFQKSYRKYLTPEQFESQVPLRSFGRLGGVICGGSDSPVQHQNPFLQIHGMVNFPLEDQRLSVYEALRTYTYNAAWASFEENDRGTISEGKAADFIVTDRDPFRLPPDQILDTSVEACCIDGIERKSRPVTAISLAACGLFRRRFI